MLWKTDQNKGIEKKNPEDQKIQQKYIQKFLMGRAPDESAFISE